MTLAKPVVSYTLIGLCVVVFGLQTQAWEYFVGHFALWPIGEWFSPVQILSSAFLHGNLTHLLFNMLGLYMFGADVERVIGNKRFALLYFISVVFAAGLQLLTTHLAGEQNPSLGASGGLFGVMFMFAAIFPKRTIVPLIPPIPMPAWLFVTLYAAAELYFGATNTFKGIAHFAHLGGLLGGIVIWLYWRALYQARQKSLG